MTVDLVILDGPDAGRRIPVPSAPLTLGRAPAAALPFPDDGFISSVHLSIQSDPQGVRITDLRSTNGTFLNGERITSGLAEIGDVIQIGTMTMQVAAAEKPQPAAAPAVFSSPANVLSRTPAEEPMMAPPALPKMDVPQPPPLNPIAATTTIPRISVDGSELFRRLETVKKNDSEVLRSALRAQMLALSGPLFLLVNAAADESILAMLAMGDVDPSRHSVWLEDATGAPARWAPYVIPTTPGSQLLELLCERGWGKGWLSVFVSTASAEELVAHFRKFLKVQMEHTGSIYFRFYDPEVLRQFLPTGNPEEIAMFFGPIREWLVEGDAKSTMLKATMGSGGLDLTSVTLTDAV